MRGLKKILRRGGGDLIDSEAEEVFVGEDGARTRTRAGMRWAVRACSNEGSGN
ncbi:BQ5605_C009g05508 [Microbotryum silenes-dioicae]|uniref:BQ5605_C009g05508 protein n=1 Tax=Microbotryum silenes-dioicae TaxID=796604 RepID=A0A2X0N750_9BASI|nr:BQ5605_C009g05508 [Microbotryum silenes-dioicae]